VLGAVRLVAFGSFAFLNQAAQTVRASFVVFGGLNPVPHAVAFGEANRDYIAERLTVCHWLISLCYCVAVLRSSVGVITILVPDGTGNFVNKT
jgi:hypothetical protein